MFTFIHTKHVDGILIKWNIQDNKPSLHRTARE